MSAGLMNLVPAWVERVPVHLQLLMVAFLGLHVLGVVGAVWYYFSSAASNPPFKKKMG